MFPLRYQRAYVICVLVLVFGTLSFTVPYSDLQRKLISDDQYDYEFYVTLKQLRQPQPGKNYHWFKGGKIHQSTSGIGGALLHDTYKKFYKNKAIAQQGRFAMGLKEGAWKAWFKNGTLKTESHWANGNRTGLFLKRNEKGDLLVSGYYQRNQKHGVWIDHELKDTVIYKKGAVVIPDSTETSFFKKLFKKQQDSLRSDTTKTKNSFFNRLFKKKKKDSLKMAPAPGNKEEKKKDSFFQRLFKKKDKKSEPPKS